MIVNPVIILFPKGSDLARDITFYLLKKDTAKLSPKPGTVRELSPSNETSAVDIETIDFQEAKNERKGERECRMYEAQNGKLEANSM